MGQITKIYNINPGMRGITSVMQCIEKSLPHAVLVPWSQVSLHVSIPSANEIELCELLDGLAVFYAEVS
jgi:hypothetical protein